jgi:GNAT superfamily N-acetyltransferase
VVGFFLEDECRTKKKLSPQNGENLLIVRLALNKGEQGKGRGVRLLAAALHQALRASDSVGFRAVIVDTLENEVEGFYLKFGFRKLPGVQRRLFVSVKEVRASLQAVVR